MSPLMLLIIGVVLFVLGTKTESTGLLGSGIAFMFWAGVLYV